MNKFLVTKTGVVILLLALSFSLSFAAKRNINVRNINIAGLIFNAGTLSPVGSANIYDAADHLLGTTDNNGYFKISLSYAKSGELYFTLKIKKQGYQAFSQSEHWGDMAGGTKAVMYFGLKEHHSGANAFSTFGGSSDDLSYSSVFAHFNKVREEKEFNDKLIKAETGNENALVRIDDKLYIVDNGGWIQIHSVHDSIFLNNKQAIIADQLNGVVKRENIKSMTPLGLKGNKFAIYTR